MSMLHLGGTWGTRSRGLRGANGFDLVRLKQDPQNDQLTVLQNGASSNLIRPPKKEPNKGFPCWSPFQLWLNLRISIFSSALLSEPKGKVLSPFTLIKPFCRGLPFGCPSVWTLISVFCKHGFPRSTTDHFPSAILGCHPRPGISEGVQCPEPAVFESSNLFWGENGGPRHKSKAKPLELPRSEGPRGGAPGAPGAVPRGEQTASAALEALSGWSAELLPERSVPVFARERGGLSGARERAVLFW